jgi:hypothetical protein
LPLSIASPCLFVLVKHDWRMWIILYFGGSIALPQFSSHSCDDCPCPLRPCLL